MPSSILMAASNHARLEEIPKLDFRILPIGPRLVIMDRTWNLMTLAVFYHVTRYFINQSH